MERTKKQAATQPKLPSSPGWWCRPAISATLAEAGGLQFKACLESLARLSQEQINTNRLVETLPGP